MKRLEENDDLIVIIKPPGISSQGKDSLETQLSEELNTTIYPVHRLDQPVGGVMVYAKNEKMAAYLSKQIQDHTFEKTYLAIIEGQMEDKGTLEDLLYHDRQKNKTYVVRRERKGVKKAILHYETLQKEETHSLVKIKLETGRTHQIRVQFASRKHPLMGDGKYGSKTNGNCALFCHEISFIYKGERLTFTALPDYPPFAQ